MDQKPNKIPNDFLESQTDVEETIVLPKHHHVWLWTGIIVLCLIAAGGYYYWQGYCKNQTTETVAVVPNEGREQAQTEVKTYTNEALGYAFTIPDKLPEFTTYQQSTYDETYTEYFEFAVDDKNWNSGKPSAGFYILAIPNDQVEAMKSSCKKDASLPWFNCLYEKTENKGQNTIIGKNSNFTFAYTRADRSTDYPKNFTPGFFSLIDEAMASMKFTEPTHKLQASKLLLEDIGGVIENEGYNYEQSISLQNRKTGKKTVLVPSVKTALPELKENLILSPVAYFEDADEMYFTVTLSDTDGGSKGLYRYSIKTKKFTKLKIGEFYHTSGSGNVSLSPFGKFIVSSMEPNFETKAQKLRLLDLRADTVKIIVQLKAAESFTTCQCLGPGGGRLDWVTPTTIRYEVYDIAPNGDGNYKFIETRVITIP